MFYAISMSEAEDSRERALVLILEYLKGRYSDQLASLRDVDAKIKLRLTVCAAAVGLVTLGLPSLAKTTAPFPLVTVAVLALLVFGLCLFRTLALALRVLEARISLPGFDAAAFERAARYEGLAIIPALQDLVVNYAKAVEKNMLLIAERKLSGQKLKLWGRCTILSAFVTIAILGIVYASSGLLTVPQATEEKCDGTELRRYRESAHQSSFA